MYANSASLTQQIAASRLKHKGSDPHGSWPHINPAVGVCAGCRQIAHSHACVMYSVAYTFLLHRDGQASIGEYIQ